MDEIYTAGSDWLGRPARVVRILIISTVVASVMQWLIDAKTGRIFTGLFSLNGGYLFDGQVWRLLTYMFLHDGIWHILVNMLMLYVFGRDIEAILGAGRFLILYGACGILAGLGWVLISADESSHCIGASGAVFGIVGVFASVYPHRRITLLLYLIPVTMTARTMALVLGAIALGSLFVDDGNIAHAAHLIGGVVGYAYGWHLAHPRMRVRPFWRGLTFRRTRRVDVEPPSPDEVDRLLEKVRRHGLHSLSRAERAKLERASRYAARR